MGVDILPASELFPPRTSPSQEQIEQNMRKALELQHKAQVLHDKRPFAAILIGPDHQEVLLVHQSVSHVEHAESCLARLAATHYSQTFLWKCTMYTTWEPCAMCTGTVYWANIGRIIYGASYQQLLELTGSGNTDNMTMWIPCEDIIRGGEKKIEVQGPVDGIDKMIMEDSDLHWREFRKASC